MNNETGQRLTEAIWALTNELRLFREQLPAAPTTEPSQNGAAPFTSGDAVTVTNPRSEWYGATGRVLDPSGTALDETHTHIGFPGHTPGTHNNHRWIPTDHLTKAEDK